MFFTKFVMPVAAAVVIALCVTQMILPAFAGKPWFSMFRKKKRRSRTAK